MHPALHRVLLAYRPLYLNGLLKDGPYRLPDREPGAARPASTAPRALLVALSPLPGKRPR